MLPCFLWPNSSPLAEHHTKPGPMLAAPFLPSVCPPQAAPRSLTPGSRKDPLHSGGARKGSPTNLSFPGPLCLLKNVPVDFVVLVLQLVQLHLPQLPVGRNRTSQALQQRGTGSCQTEGPGRSGPTAPSLPHQPQFQGCASPRCPRRAGPEQRCATWTTGLGGKGTTLTRALLFIGLLRDQRGDLVLLLLLLLQQPARERRARGCHSCQASPPGPAMSRGCPASWHAWERVPCQGEGTASILFLLIRCTSQEARPSPPQKHFVFFPVLVPPAFLAEFLNFRFQVLLFLQEFLLLLLHLLLGLFALDRDILDGFQDLLGQNKPRPVRPQHGQGTLWFEICHPSRSTAAGPGRAQVSAESVCAAEADRHTAAEDSERV